MFKTNKELQEMAAKEGYAIGAFNTNNLEITKAIVQAAQEERSPFILAVTPSAMDYAGAEYLAALARVAQAQTGLLMSLHLDHGLKYEDVVKAIKNGFSSVMIDGSKLPFEENIALTAEVAKMAHAAGASVEGELGRLVGTEDAVTVSEREAAMTNPDQAAEFIARTGIDALAVAIGNAHGWYKGKPELDFERLRAIREKVDILLVLHGASGIPPEDIKRAIKLGVTKINIDTETRDAFKRGISNFIQDNPDIIDPRKILKPAIAEMVFTVKEKIELFGSAGKA